MYKWQRNDVNLSDEGKVSGTNTNTLTIASVGKSNEGMYKCDVSNAAGATTSTNAVQLTVRKYCFSCQFSMCVCVCVCVCVRE